MSVTTAPTRVQPRRPMVPPPTTPRRPLTLDEYLQQFVDVPLTAAARAAGEL